MGEMADWLIEQGEDAHAAHCAGQCDGPCADCEHEARQAQRRQKSARRSRRGTNRTQPKESE